MYSVVPPAPFCPPASSCACRAGLWSQEVAVGRAGWISEGLLSPVLWSSCGKIDEAVHGSSAPAAGKAQTVARLRSQLKNCSLGGECACALDPLLLLPPLLLPQRAGNMTKPAFRSDSSRTCCSWTENQPKPESGSQGFLHGRGG